MPHKRPNIFEFLDLLSYLSEYVRYRKSLAAKFSYEIWTEELGFKSRSYLRMIVMGKKKATESFVEAFSNKALESSHEKEYFYYLVQYSQSSTHKSRQLFSKKLVQLIHQVVGQKEIEIQYDFLADPLLPRLLVLLSFEDLRKNALFLSSLLGITTKDTEVSLKKLESLGLAHKDESAAEPQWTSLNTKFKIPGRLGDLAVHSFHENSLFEALKAFSMPVETRRYRGLILPLNEGERQELFQLLDNFANEVILKYQSDKYESRRLYQLNYNVVPLTASLSASPQRDSLDFPSP